MAYLEISEVFSTIDISAVETSDYVKKLRSNICAILNKTRDFHFNNTKESHLDLRNIAFSSTYGYDIYEFGLSKTTGSTTDGFCLAGDCSSNKNEPLKEYCCVLLCDGTYYEAFTLKEEPETTYIYHNSQFMGKCCFELHKKLTVKWRDSWQLYMGETFFGSVKSFMDFMGENRESNWVSPKSLKIVRKDERSLDIHLRDQTKFIKRVFIILRNILYCLSGKARKVVHTNLVIPRDDSDFEDENTTKFYFIVIIIFRMLYYPDLSCSTSSD